jgi:sporulation protein YlmC with PRC-barrel domain
MAIVPEIHASRLLEKTVIDRHGKRVGQVTDVVVDLGDDLPSVLGLLVRSKHGKARYVPWETVQVLVREYFSLSVGKADLAESEPSPDLVHLSRDLLDKQIVDLNGLKVRRVNDVKLAEVNGTLRVVAVEVGLRGLLRRLGLRKLVHFIDRVMVKQVPDFLISWRDVEQIAGAPSKLKLLSPMSGSPSSTPPTWRTSSRLSAGPSVARSSPPSTWTWQLTRCRRSIRKCSRISSST